MFAREFVCFPPICQQVSIPVATIVVCGFVDNRLGINQRLVNGAMHRFLLSVSWAVGNSDLHWVVSRECTETGFQMQDSQHQATAFLNFQLLKCFSEFLAYALISCVLVELGATRTLPSIRRP